MNKPLVYLDYAAATPVDAAVLMAMRPFWREQFYNPSAGYGPAREVKHALEAARAEVAGRLGAKPSEIIFTAGGTEANNLAIDGVMRQFPYGNMVVSAVEHEAVLAAAAGYDCREAAVDQHGGVDLEDLTRRIDDQTVLVSVMYASSEVGAIQPIREISKIITKTRTARSRSSPAAHRLPLYFHTDAAQAANYLDVHVARLGVDLMALNGAKIYAPKQSGALYVSSRAALTALIRGGGQERGLRGGTENVAFAVGLAAALDMAQTGRRAETARLRQLQKYVIGQITRELPELRLNGRTARMLPNFVHLSVPGGDSERLLLMLEARGVLAAAGSACRAGSGEVSHVLKAMGFSHDEARGSLRLTLGRGTTKAELDRAVLTLKDILK